MKEKRFFYNLIPVLIAVILLFTLLTTGVVGAAYAAEDTSELSEVERDLSRLTLDGVKFDKANYPVQDGADPQLLLFNELNYTVDSSAAFMLQVYVYNPGQYAVKEDSALNAIQMRIGNAERFSKYKLVCNSMSADKRFIKFTVSLSETEKLTVYNSLSGDKRRYEISGIELHVSGYNATEYAVGEGYTKIYTFSGQGEDLDAQLNYTVEGGTEVIKGEVKHTSWTPELHEEGNAYVGDRLVSVYFAIPNELDERYDYLKSVKCQWLSALTSGILATDSNKVYSGLYNYISSFVTAKRDEIDFLNMVFPNHTQDFVNEVLPSLKFYWKNDIGFALALNPKVVWRNAVEQEHYLDTDVALGYLNRDFSEHDKIETLEHGEWINCKGWLTSLYMLANINYETDFTVSSSEVLKMIRAISDGDVYGEVNDKKVAGKYPSILFSEWDEEYTQRIIDLEKGIAIDSDEIDKELFKYLFGSDYINGNSYFRGMKAIQKITENDLVGSPEHVSYNLKISKNDYEDFKYFYEKATKNNATVYLMRLGIDTYYSFKMTYLETDHPSWYINFPFSSHPLVYHIKDGADDPHSYLSYDRCYLDFDIIDLEYKLNDVSYIIPVQMSPIDITPELKPPPNFYNPPQFWKLGCIIIAGLLAAGVIIAIVEGEFKKDKKGKRL